MNTGGEKPFFVYLSYNAVHQPDQVPKETIAKFDTLPQKERVLAAMVSEFDTGIGRLLCSTRRGSKNRSNPPRNRANAGPTART